MPKLSASYDNVHGHLKGSDHSLTEDFGICAIKMQGVKITREGLHEKLRSCARFRKQVQRLMAQRLKY